MPPKPVVLLSLAVLFASLAFASTAAADSLVYVGGDGNIWLANPDGSGQYRVTADGTPSDPYFSPSQTDSGIVVAGKGAGFSGRLYRMRQNGELLNAPVPTPVPPFGPKVAPGGGLIAYYTIAAVTYPGCTYCISTYDQTLYSKPDALTPYESIPMPHCCENPSWMGDSGLLLTNGSPTAWYSAVGEDTAHEWFADGDDTGSPSMEGLYDAELSPGGDRIAAVRATFPGETIGLYSANGPPPAAPTIKCAISGAVQRDGNDYEDPTWSPDGRALAWEEQGGVMIASLPSLDDCGAGGEPKMVFPGATDPDWSPAANAPPPRPAGGGGGGGGAGGGGSAGGARAPKVSVAVARQRLRTVLRRGLVVGVRCSAACSISGRLELPRSAARKLHLAARDVHLAARAVTVAKGSAKLRKAGKVKLKLRFTRRARSRLSRARVLKGTLRIQAKGASGKSRTVRRSLKVKR